MAKSSILIPIKRCLDSTGLPLPGYQSASAAGMDLYAALPHDKVIQPQAVLTVPCGFSIAIPEGYEGQVRPRSGLAAKHGISIINSPGTIDSDYRGEVKVLLINLGMTAFTVKRGMRIAQLLVSPVPRIEWKEVDDLEPSNRADGGFGHTGQ